MKTLKKVRDYELVQDVQTQRCYMRHGQRISKWLSEQVKNMLLKHCNKGEFLFFGAIMTH